MRTRTTLIGLACAVTTITGCMFSITFDVFDGSAEADFELALPADGITHVEVFWSQGSVVVRAEDSVSQIEAAGRRIARDRTDAAASIRLDELEVTLEAGGAGGSTAVLRMTGVDDGDAMLSAEVELTIPTGVDLTVVSTSGEVAVRGVRGVVSIETTVGDITVLDQQGDTSVETTVGGIDIESDSGDVDAISQNGSVSVDARPGDTGRIRAASTTGRILIRVPSDTAATLTLSGGLVDAELTDFTVEELVDSFNGVTATLNGGGGEIVGETVHGLVTFQSLD